MGVCAMKIPIVNRPDLTVDTDKMADMQALISEKMSELYNLCETHKIPIALFVHLGLPDAPSLRAVSLSHPKKTEHEAFAELVSVIGYWLLDNGNVMSISPVEPPPTDPTP